MNKSGTIKELATALAKAQSEIKSAPFNATIYFKNGKKYWIDPVINVTETDELISIENDCYTYDFPKVEVDRVEYNEPKTGHTIDEDFAHFLLCSGYYDKPESVIALLREAAWDEPSATIASLTAERDAALKRAEAAETEVELLRKAGDYAIAVLLMLEERVAGEFNIEQLKTARIQWADARISALSGGAK